MEARKMAAIVLSIIVLIVIFYTAVLPKIEESSDKTLSFKTCKVHFNYRKGANPDIYRAAQNELALCLCKVYDKNPDTAISNKVMQIYKQYGAPISPDRFNSARYNNLDSVFKYRKMAFDTLVTWD